MNNLLFWIYLVNATIIIVHELDSVYWKEWALFNMPGGIQFFLLIHFPLIGAILYGLILVHQQSFSGLIFSIILATSGIFAFFIHFYFIKKGYDEFKTPISLFILISTFTLSSVQLSLTVYLL